MKTKAKHPRANRSEDNDGTWSFSKQGVQKLKKDVQQLNLATMFRDGSADYELRLDSTGGELFPLHPRAVELLSEIATYIGWSMEDLWMSPWCTVFLLLALHKSGQTARAVCLGCGDPLPGTLAIEMLTGGTA